MGWFSKLIPVQVKEVNQAKEVAKATEELMSTVAADKALLEQQNLSSNNTVVTPPVAIPSVSPASVGPTTGKPTITKDPTHVSRVGSSLSPFASRILEKAKIESLKDDDQRQKITSPSELFMSSDEETHRVERIKSIALEKGKHVTDKFTHGARVVPNTNFLIQHHLKAH